MLDHASDETNEAAPRICPFCKGSGNCGKCGGGGVLAIYRRWVRKRLVPCQACEGSGKCPLCKGKGSLGAQP